MSRSAAISEARSLSELLAEVGLAGRTWCYSDIAAQAGFSVPPSDAVLFHAVLHGSARVATTGGAVAELAAGDMVFVLSGEAHALRTTAQGAASAHELLRAERPVDIPPSVAIGPPGPVAARVLSGRLRARWPGEVKRPALPPLLRLGKDEGHAAGALLAQGAVALAGMGAGASAVLTRIAALLLTAGLRADPRCRQLLSPSPHDPIAQARQLIESNPSASWTVEKLARSVGMGRSNFAAHFTQTVGRAPMEVVAEHRMEHAATLLRQGRLKIAEISEMAGYSSEAAFSRRFTRHFGLSPSQMRERARAAGAGDTKPAASFPPLLAARLTEGAATFGRRQPGTGEDEAKPGGFFRLGARD